MNHTQTSNYSTTIQCIVYISDDPLVLNLYLSNRNTTSSV